MHLLVTEGMMNNIEKMLLSRSKALVGQRTEERKQYKVMKNAMVEEKKGTKAVE